jgi:hypothetical protein
VCKPHMNEQEVRRLFTALQPDSAKPYGFAIAPGTDGEDGVFTPSETPTFLSTARPPLELAATAVGAAVELPEHVSDRCSQDNEDIGDWSLGRSFRAEVTDGGHGPGQSVPGAEACNRLLAHPEHPVLGTTSMGRAVACGTESESPRAHRERVQPQPSSAQRSAITEARGGGGIGLMFEQPDPGVLWTHVVSPLLGFGESLTPIVSPGHNAMTNKPAIVSSVLPASPAEMCGLRRGDSILMVDGRRATIVNVKDLLRGSAGSGARLTVERLAERFEVVVVRAEASHLERLESVVVSMEALAAALTCKELLRETMVAEDSVSVSKSVDASLSASARAEHWFRNRAADHNSPATGPLLAGLRNQILDYFRWRVAGDMELAQKACQQRGMHSDIRRDLDLMAADLRVLSSAPFPPPDRSRECQLLQEQLLKSECVARSLQERISKSEHAAWLIMEAFSTRLSARALRAQAFGLWRLHLHRLRRTRADVELNLAKRARSALSDNFRHWLASAAVRRSIRHSAARYKRSCSRSSLLGVLLAWAGENDRSRREFEARRREQELMAVVERANLERTAAGEAKMRAMTEMAEKHAIEQEELKKEQKKQLSMSAEAHTAELDKVTAEVNG